MNLAWIRVVADAGGGAAVVLREGEREIAVARFVAEWERRQFAQDLKCTLARF